MARAYVDKLPHDKVGDNKGADQFFIINPAPLRRALRRVPLHGHHALEIGVGTGVFTSLALGSGPRTVTGFEIEPSLIPPWLMRDSRFSLVSGDFKEFDFDRFQRENRGPFALIGNPPYNQLHKVREVINSLKIPAVLVIPSWRYFHSMEYDGDTVPSFGDDGYDIIGWLRGKDFYPHLTRQQDGWWKLWHPVVARGWGYGETPWR